MGELVFFDHKNVASWTNRIIVVLDYLEDTRFVVMEADFLPVQKR